MVVCLGKFAWDVIAPAAAARSSATAPRLDGGRFTLLGCFHPSQQNTFTGKLTAPMIEAVLRRAREIAGLS